MGTRRDVPPDQWEALPPATQVTPDIYFAWLHDDDSRPTFWHWCTVTGRWLAAGTQNHQLIAREPLHLEPSLLWECCGLHGWIRAGHWTGA
jgi:hypothetical protein